MQNWKVGRWESEKPEGTSAVSTFSLSHRLTFGLCNAPTTSHPRSCNLALMTYPPPMTWLDLCKDKHLRDLPYKIELNRAGKIIMSPTRNRHGYYANKIARLLSKLMGRGETLVELAIETDDATKVADAAWASPKIFKIICDEPSCSVAPEICVEVRSPFNPDAEMEEKCALYLKAGAKEFWVCDELGRMKFFDARGPMKVSRLCPKFPAQL